MRPVTVIIAVAGVLVGALQVYILSCFLKNMIAKNYTVSVVAFLAKLCLYAASFSAVVLLCRETLIPFGIGVGGGIVAASLVSFVSGQLRNK